LTLYLITLFFWLKLILFGLPVRCSHADRRWTIAATV